MLIHRAYALYGKSKLVLVGTCAITVVAAALGIVRLRLNYSFLQSLKDDLSGGLGWDHPFSV